jgi:hypothetical protein
MYCIVLYCIILYHIVLYCIILYCIILYRTKSCCITLYCILLYCITLYYIVIYYIISCHVKSYHIMSCQIISYHIMYIYIYTCAYIYQEYSMSIPTIKSPPARPLTSPHIKACQQRHKDRRSCLTPAGKTNRSLGVDGRIHMAMGNSTIAGICGCSWSS